MLFRLLSTRKFQFCCAFLQINVVTFVCRFRYRLLLTWYSILSLLFPRFIYFCIGQSIAYCTMCVILISLLCISNKCHNSSTSALTWPGYLVVLIWLSRYTNVITFNASYFQLFISCTCVLNSLEWIIQETFVTMMLLSAWSCLLFCESHPSSLEAKIWFYILIWKPRYDVVIYWNNVVRWFKYGFGFSCSWKLQLSWLQVTAVNYIS